MSKVYVCCALNIKLRDLNTNYGGTAGLSSPLEFRVFIFERVIRMEKEKYYITTAIVYTSSKPHIGNVYDSILSDAIARFKRKQGYDVLFQTGTDEHGEKIEIKAKEANIKPQEYVDNIANHIKEIWKMLDISFDKFVRTTDEHHEKVVKHIFNKLYNQGDIYLGEYKGLYCVPCESFFTETQLVDGKCPDCGREVQETHEEAYFFKLSNYADRLVKYLDENPDFIVPVSRKNEMYNNFIKPGLQDLCVSRTSFNWGIPVDFDPKHVIYVWIDALANYITNIGYDVDNTTLEFNKYWPADLQVIGKDIVRFHMIYWPIILMALDLPLPKKIYGHPWLLFQNDKMSKSKGNVMYPEKLVEYFGVDAVRYYTLKEVSFSNDGNVTYDLIIERFNSDLANTLGNLVNRTISMANKYFESGVSYKEEHIKTDEELINMVNNLESRVSEKMNNLFISEALGEIFDVLRRSNKYIDENEPWILAKDEKSKDRLETVLYNLLESIRVCASELSPFLPQTSEKIFAQLNIVDKKSTFNKDNLYSNMVNEPLFQRINKEEKLKEINA